MTARRRVILCAGILAIMTGAVVQDRVTAAAAREYAAIQRATPVTGTAAVTIESIMAPAIRRSVYWGVLSAGIVLTVGVVVAARWR